LHVADQLGEAAADRRGVGVREEAGPVAHVPEERLASAEEERPRRLEALGVVVVERVVTRVVRVLELEERDDAAPRALVEAVEGGEVAYHRLAHAPPPRPPRGTARPVAPVGPAPRPPPGPHPRVRAQPLSVCG